MNLPVLFLLEVPERPQNGVLAPIKCGLHEMISAVIYIAQPTCHFGGLGWQ